MKTASPLTFSSGSGSKFSIHIGLSLWVENHRGDVVGGEERLELSLIIAEAAMRLIKLALSDTRPR